MKEAAARSKICPIMSNHFVKNPQRLEQIEGNKVYCQGSSCMAWNQTNEKEGFCSLIENGTKKESTIFS
jgi:hypothetical protein